MIGIKLCIHLCLRPPPVNNDHPESCLSNFSTRITSEQPPPVNYNHLKSGQNFNKTCLQQPQFYDENLFSKNTDLKEGITTLLQ